MPTYTDIEKTTIILSTLYCKSLGIYEGDMVIPSNQFKLPTEPTPVKKENLWETVKNTSTMGKDDFDRLFAHIESHLGKLYSKDNDFLGYALSF